MKSILLRDGGSYHSKGAGRDGSHPVDIGINTQSYALHAHIYIQPEFMLPLQNGRQKLKLSAVRSPRISSANVPGEA
jgi:hypothetical protein